MGHHLQTTVNYYDDPADGSPPTPVYVGRYILPSPLPLTYPPPCPPPNINPKNSTQVTNKRPTISVPVTVTDVTGNESSFSLDVHGFAYHRHESAEAAGGFHDETALKQRYYPECEELLKTLCAATPHPDLRLPGVANSSSTGATRALAFDHKVRRGPAFWYPLPVPASCSQTDPTRQGTPSPPKTTPPPAARSTTRTSTSPTPAPSSVSATSSLPPTPPPSSAPAAGGGRSSTCGGPSRRCGRRRWLWRTRGAWRRGIWWLRRFCMGMGGGGWSLGL